MQPQQFAMPYTEPMVILPRLVIEGAAWDMIMAYVRTNPEAEINGFCYVTADRRSNTFYVATADDVFITQQTVTPGSVEVTGDAYALAYDRAVTEGRGNELRVQWHSHTHDVYCSPTDMGNIAQFGQAGASWLISLVVNAHGDMHARYDTFRPVRVGGKIQVTIHRPVDPAFTARAAAEVAALVTVEAPKIEIKTKATRRQPRR